MFRTVLEAHEKRRPDGLLVACSVFALEDVIQSRIHPPLERLVPGLVVAVDELHPL